MAFDVEGARKAGYSDAEIVAHLAQSAKFDLAGAKKAGYTDSDVIAHLSALPAAPAVAQIPGQSPDVKAPPAVRPAAPAEPASIGQQIIGAGETGLQLATGATGGTLGMLGGTLKGLAEQILSGQFGTPEAANLVERSAMQGAEALTYQPRTAAGQEQSEAVGKVLQQAIPVAAVAPALRPPVGAPVAPAAPARVIARAGAEGVARDVAGEAGAAAVGKAIDTASRVADLATKRVSTLPRRALEALRQEQQPTPGTMGSAGAAGTDMAAQRRAVAADLPVPVKLTKGQATRDAAQLKFEVETAKMPEEGAALRERAVEQNKAILENFDAWLDQTGAEAPNLRAVGVAVDNVLVEQAKRDKTQIRTAYKEAEKAGDMEQPVPMTSVIAHLNESAPDAATAPLLDVARRRAVQLGLATEGPDGTLVAQPVPLKIAETYRQAVSRATDFEPTNVRQSTIIKGLVDEATDGLGGDLYRQARALRQRYAQNYENRATVAKLLETKRGTTDRRVAFEDVFDHVVLKGSLDDVRNVRRVLQRGGNDGQQAWREVQGATMRWLKDESTKGVATDSAGNSVISPAGLNKAIGALEHDGRLDFIFGKKGAQQLRDLNDLAKYVKTVPPEAGVNTSNTAATLLAAFGDIAFSGMTGTPAPVVTGARLAVRQIKNSQLRRRIQAALDDADKRGVKAKVDAAAARRNNETIH